jgi:hypothetical protein
LLIALGTGLWGWWPSAEGAASVSGHAENAQSKGSYSEGEAPTPSLPVEAMPVAAQDSGVESKPATSGLVAVSLVLTVAALLVSVLVNIILLRWRRAVEEDPMSLETSVLVEKVQAAANTQSSRLSTVIETLRSHGEFIQDSSQAVLRESSKTRSESEQLLESFRSLHVALSKKDAEIDRLKSGYDLEVFKRFLSRFLRLDNVISEEVEDLGCDNADAKQALSEVQALLRDALAESGLEQFSPDLGLSIRESEGVETAAETPTSEQGRVLTIAEVIEPGWRCRVGDGFTVVKDARVAVFVELESA